MEVVFIIVGVIIVLYLFGSKNEPKKPAKDYYSEATKESIKRTNQSVERSRKLIKQHEPPITEKPVSLKKWADEYVEKESLTTDDFLRFKQNKVDSEYLTPNYDIEDKSHYLFGKKVVITGTFELFPYRNELAHLLWSVGADIDAVVGKKTDVVILGEKAGWKKMELIEKYQPQVIDQDILMEYFPNYKPKFI